MNKTKTFIRRYETLYYYDGRNTRRSRKQDYKGHSKTPHGAKRAAYKHLDKDYGDAKMAIIIDLKTGLELWILKTTETGIGISAPDSVKTDAIVSKDKRNMEIEGKRF